MYLITYANQIDFENMNPNVNFTSLNEANMMDNNIMDANNLQMFAAMQQKNDL